jgi:Domain of unknown function (DUF4174)
MIRALGTACAALLALTGQSVAACAMSGYLWKNRPVLVFAPSEADTGLAEQRREFAASRAGLIERNVVIVWVVGDGVATEFGPGPGMSAAQLRTRFGAPRAGFRVVLVGKDGGTKLAKSSPMATGALFGTIDAMPMRRDEMRRGG